MNAAELMAEALRVAERGRGHTRPNPIVGCVIARGGRIVGRGFHHHAGGPHAEINALQDAGSRARGADVYVTLEPCSHHGRTGPCTDALITAGVRRVIAALRDPNPLVDGNGAKKLRRAGISVEVGLLADEAERQNEVFLHAMRHGRPFVVAKIAESLDGRVATSSGESKWITGEPARRAGRRLRAELDAILVGVGTVLEDDPELTARMKGARDPIRIILDTQGRTPLKSRVLRVRSKAPTWIVVGRDLPVRKRRAFERAGAEVIPLRTRRGSIALDALMSVLHERRVRSLLIEGGPTVMGSFVDARLIDKVHAFVAPLIIGGTGARSSVGAVGAARLADSLALSDLTVEQLGRDLHLVGYRRGF